MKKPQFLTTSAVAQAAAVPEQTVRRLEARGVISATRDTVGRRLFTQEAVTKIREYRARRAAGVAKPTA